MSKHDIAVIQLYPLDTLFVRFWLIDCVEPLSFSGCFRYLDVELSTVNKITFFMLSNFRLCEQ